jgi:hypothetical protein
MPFLKDSKWLNACTFHCELNCEIFISLLADRLGWLGLKPLENNYDENR